MRAMIASRICATIRTPGAPASALRASRCGRPHKQKECRWEASACAIIGIAGRCAAVRQWRRHLRRRSPTPRRRHRRRPRRAGRAGPRRPPRRWRGRSAVRPPQRGPTRCRGHPRAVAGRRPLAAAAGAPRCSAATPPGRGRSARGARRLVAQSHAGQNTAELSRRCGERHTAQHRWRAVPLEMSRKGTVAVTSSMKPRSIWTGMSAMRSLSAFTSSSTSLRVTLAPPLPSWTRVR